MLCRKSIKTTGYVKFEGGGEKVLAMQSNDFGTVYQSCSLGIR